jgi:uncharacterized phiE125 gp8 family phage protein
MSTKQTSAPVALAVSLAEAKDTLRIEQADTALDGQIETWIRGITAEAEHATGRAFINRGRMLALDSFPDAIRFDHAPLYSVDSIQYLDAAGVQQTLDPADFYADKISEPGYVVPGRGKAWPATIDQINAVTVNFTAGYGLDETTTPEAARLYVLVRLAELFDPAAREFKETHASQFSSKLLDSLKVYA